MPFVWRDLRERTKLHQPFVEALDELGLTLKSTFYITEGYRTPERSDMLYANYKNWLDGGKKGTPAPKAAPAGLSAHNWGLAIDVALDGDDKKSGLQMLWDINSFGWLELKAKVVLNSKLVGGFTFGDTDHIEFKGWKGWRQLRDPLLYKKLYG